MLHCLCELFTQIHSNKKRTGAIPPKKFISTLRKENEVFRTLQHQDAHEFFNYLLNTIDELLGKEDGCGGNVNSQPSNDNRTSMPGDEGDEQKSLGSTPEIVFQEKFKIPNEDTPTTATEAPEKKKSFVHELFEGTLASETRCLTCETITSREEAFIDLSIDVEPNASVYHCLRNFSSSETLNQDDKFFCDACASLQEAHKCIRIKKAPLVLAIHLKRFKYIEQLQRHKKLSYRVPFSTELRIPTMEEEEDALYHLFAVVVHVGSGPNMGHYVSLVKSQGHWLLFDDDLVEHIPESYLNSVFGVSQEYAGTTPTGYILFYSLNDCATKLDPTLAAGGSAKRPNSVPNPLNPVPH
jgi:ubiquitin carboxyl-terminal hydrolase 12/46